MTAVDARPLPVRFALVEQLLDAGSTPAEAVAAAGWKSCNGASSTATSAGRKDLATRIGYSRRVLAPTVVEAPKPSKGRQIKAPDGGTIGTFTVIFPIEGPMSPAHMTRSATNQVTAMPEARDLAFHGTWTWSTVKDRRGRPSHLIGRITASSPRPAAEHALESRDLAAAVRGAAPRFADWIDRAVAESEVAA